MNHIIKAEWWVLQFSFICCKVITFQITNWYVSWWYDPEKQIRLIQFVFGSYTWSNTTSLFNKYWCFCYWNVIITLGTTKFEKKKKILHPFPPQKWACFRKNHKKLRFSNFRLKKNQLGANQYSKINFRDF